jgi:lysophospholipase L1-like esterase
VLAAALFVAAEVTARIYIPLRGYNLQEVREAFQRRRERRLTGTWAQHEHEHPYLPYHARSVKPGEVMPGLRAAPKSPDEFRIFCLGGSTTHCCYPGDLETALRDEFVRHGKRLEVVTAADVSWTSAETFIDFGLRCIPYQPDAVIVYHGINDVWPAFGKEWSPDYAHWRRRLIRNTPLVWDYLPHLLDTSAAFVQLRAWVEGATRVWTWKRAMMQYVPDFSHDPYHGVAPFRENMTNLIALARARRIPVILVTHAYNAEFENERYLQALRDINEVTRSLADESNGVFLVDAAAQIQGDYRLMEDVCHFRRDGDGETLLVGLLADGVRRYILDRSSPAGEGGNEERVVDRFPVDLQLEPRP